MLHGPCDEMHIIRIRIASSKLTEKAYLIGDGWFGKLICKEMSAIAGIRKYEYNFAGKIIKFTAHRWDHKNALTFKVNIY